MTTELQLYRGPDFRGVGRIPLISVVRPALEGLLGLSLGDALITLWLHEVPDEVGPQGQPQVHNLMPDYGYATVVVEAAGRVVYRHPHPVAELIVEPLREVLLEAYPEETHWGFSFPGLEIPPEARRPEPTVQGVASVLPYGEGEGPAFQIRRLPDPPPAEAGLADFGISVPGGSHPAFAKVLVPRSLCADLTRGRALSDEVEEGGFLIGRPYRDRDVPDTYLLEITAAPAAEYTGASLLHLTFTGDSFDAVKRALRTSHTDKRLLGWFHTHLFPATDEMGLSSIDLQLHFTTFRQPWQLAGLINLDGAHRTLRFYVRQENAMVLCPHWEINERD